MRNIAFIVVIGSAFIMAGLAPYLPYPERYCAKHPSNQSCLTYRDQR